MKQKIDRYSNNCISYICNYNNSGQRHGLQIGYDYNGSIRYIQNWFNDKRFGLYTLNYYSGEIEQKYYL